MGGWVGPRASLDGCGKPRSHRARSPDRPASSESLYRLSYPSPIWTVLAKLIQFTLYRTILNIHFNIILPSMPRYSKWTLSFSFAYRSPECVHLLLLELITEGCGSSSFSLTPLRPQLVWYATRSAKHLAPVWTQAFICRVKQHIELCQPTGNPDVLVVVMLITVYFISVLAVLETACRLTRCCREGIPSPSGVYDTYVHPYLVRLFEIDFVWISA